MTGYQEIVSDPSYSGQLVTMTYPEIGNTGVNSADMESRTCFADGFIVHHMNEPSNWRAEQSLQDFLQSHAVPGLAGVDTRTLTIKLRNQGTLKGFLSITGSVGEAEAIEKAYSWEGLDRRDYASRVTCSASYQWDPEGSLSASWGIAEELPHADLHIVAYDFGIKWNILRSLRRCGMRTSVVPAGTSARDVLALKPDGVFLSNGPADPAAVTYAIASAKELIGKVPIMGICLGHQLLGLAVGGRTFRLKFGHHGCNHPVKDLTTGNVEITSQNHNFSVDQSTLDPSLITVTHINLNDQSVEGIKHNKEPMFAVQYHPEASPGPHDASYLFKRFRTLIEKA